MSQGNQLINNAPEFAPDPATGTHPKDRVNTTETPPLQGFNGFLDPVGHRVQPHINAAIATAITGFI